MKRLTRGLSKALQRLLMGLARILGPLLLKATYHGQLKRETRISDSAQEYIRSGKPLFMCFWHGRLLGLPTIFAHGGGVFPPRSRRCKAIISPSSHGRLIADIARNFNVDVIVGSSAEGGMSAARETLKAAQQGDIIGVTPDGPRGPRYQAGGVTCKIAADHQVPIFLMSWSCTWGYRFASWDHMLLPIPGGRMIYKIDGPFWASDTFGNQELSDELFKITQEVDAACGRPAPLIPTEAEIKRSRESLQAARKRKLKKLRQS